MCTAQALQEQAQAPCPPADFHTALTSAARLTSHFVLIIVPSTSTSRSLPITIVPAPCSVHTVGTRWGMHFAEVESEAWRGKAG